LCKGPIAASVTVQFCYNNEVLSELLSSEPALTYAPGDSNLDRRVAGPFC